MKSPYFNFFSQRISANRLFFFRGLIILGSGDKTMNSMEETLEFLPKYGSDGLIPVVTQDAETGEVLMLAYMNETALKETLACGEMVYYSRSRRCLWHKGATSGCVQKVVSLSVDCDQDTLLAKVRQIGEGACHTGRRSCFYRAVEGSRLRFI